MGFSRRPTTLGLTSCSAVAWFRGRGSVRSRLKLASFSTRSACRRCVLQVQILSGPAIPAQLAGFVVDCVHMCMGRCVCRDPFTVSSIALSYTTISCFIIFCTTVFARRARALFRLRALPGALFQEQAPHPSIFGPSHRFYLAHVVLNPVPSPHTHFDISWPVALQSQPFVAALTTPIVVGWTLMLSSPRLVPGARSDGDGALPFEQAASEVPASILGSGLPCGSPW